MPTRVARTGTPDLWAALPSELAPVLRPELSSLATQIRTEIQLRIPEYARPMDEQYVRAIQRGVDEALNQFVDQIADPTAPQERCAEVHRALGKAEMHEGRSLDSLQAAYRLGARLAWRRTARIGERARIAPRTMLLLGEAIYAHIDELAALSVEGFAEAQARAAGTRARRRRRLLELLLTDPQPPRRILAEAAEAADWMLPDTLVVAALERTGGAEPRSAPLVGWDALGDLDGDHPHLLVPHPADATGEPPWEQQLAGWRVALGPRVELHRAPHALRWARELLDLSHAGLVPDRPVLHCEDHLTHLLLLSDETLTRQIVHTRLAPLDRLKPKQQIRLADTLLAWLQTRGGAPEVAHRLQVHPQTVRYRLHQLEDLFGDALTDPQARFELEIALRAAGRLLSYGALTPEATTAGGSST
ncbi:helix-turn-helix domain-containing protein [Saccharopolyspora sp. NPDC047091]|uniref:helix-turn-helix domain-containing protein n=1 Tax=Saccharopolyspora sp. NPDC047091 TaxID=3155924 RepID=UPI0033F0F60F